MSPSDFLHELDYQNHSIIKQMVRTNGPYIYIYTNVIWSWPMCLQIMCIQFVHYHGRS